MMNANKICWAAALAILLAPCAAQALETAPPLYGVNEMVIQHSRMGNPTASAACTISSGEVSRMVLEAMKTNNLPALSVLSAPPLKAGVERIDVFPDVVTLQPRDKECVSWVSFAVQSKAALNLPPVTTPRSMIVTYWTGGLMVSSTVAAHPTVVNEAVKKLAGQLAQQYRNDQPAQVPLAK